MPLLSNFSIETLQIALQRHFFDGSQNAVGETRIVWESVFDGAAPQTVDDMAGVLDDLVDLYTDWSNDDDRPRIIAAVRAFLVEFMSRENAEAVVATFIEQSAPDTTE